MGARAALTQLLGLQHPVLLAPMAGVAAAVSPQPSAAPAAADIVGEMVAHCDALLGQRRVHSSEPH